MLYPHAGPSLPEARGVLEVRRAVSQPGPRGLYNTIVQIKLITGNKAPNTGPITGLLKANILQPSLHHGGHCGTEATVGQPGQKRLHSGGRPQTGSWRSCIGRRKAIPGRRGVQPTMNGMLADSKAVLCELSF